MATETNSNRYPNMTPIRVNAGPAHLPGYVVCPECLRVAKMIGNEIGYHGQLGGAYLCAGSGMPVGEIVTPIKIVSITEVF